MEEACEYGLTLGTCFVARPLEVVAVAGLLWIYFVVCFDQLVRLRVFFFCFLCFERTRPAASSYEAPLPLICLSDSTRAHHGIHRTNHGTMPSTIEYPMKHSMGFHMAFLMVSDIPRHFPWNAPWDTMAPCFISYFEVLQ